MTTVEVSLSSVYFTKMYSECPICLNSVFPAEIICSIDPELCRRASSGREREKEEESGFVTHAIPGNSMLLSLALTSHRWVGRAGNGGNNRLVKNNVDPFVPAS